MPTDTLSLYMDVAEPRIQRDRLVALVDGRHWDVLQCSATVEGITRTGMLTPLPWTAQWQNTAAGSYARLPKSAYKFLASLGSPPIDGPPGTPDKWKEVHQPFQGSIYLDSDTSDIAITTQVWPKNRAFFLSWFSYNSGQQSHINLDCGWRTAEADVSLRFWSDGKTEIFKNGSQVGQGNIYERHVTTQTALGNERSNFSGRAAKRDAKTLSQQIIEVMLIPYKRRQLLLLCNQGGGFSFTFEDIDEYDPDPTITPKGANFFWHVPEGHAMVQCAPLRYETAGDLISEKKTLRVPPEEVTEAETFVYWDAPGYGVGTVSAVLIDPRTGANFVPDGSADQCRVKVSLAGDGESTPFVYGASGIYAALTANTDDNNITTLDDYVTAVKLSVPESPTDVQMDVTLNRPDEADVANAGKINSQLRVVGNRPVVVSLGVSILTGRSQAPKWMESTTDVTRDLMLEFRDRCQAYEDYRFQDAVPYDGLELSEAFADLATLPGYSVDDLDITNFGYNLPTVGQASQGEFVLLPKVGDKCIDWIKKLWETFARHTLWGWVPTASGPRFQVTPLADLDAAESQLTLYGSTDDAFAAGADPAFVNQWVYRSYRETVIKCEANDIWVSGYNRRTGKQILAHYADTASQDPTLPPNERPANWVGEPRRYGWVDPAITSQEVANWVCATLAARLTPARKVCEIDCDFLIRPDGAPLWRGQKLTLDGIGEVRVTTLSGEFEQEYAGVEPSGDRIWRPFKYCGEIAL